MPHILLGLDLGSFSIKAALFQTTFKSFELTDLYESPPLQLENVDAADREVVIREALTRLFQENSIVPSAVITALSGVSVSTRVLTLPLPERQLEKVLPFELESYIPFDLEEIIVDYHTIESSKAETTCLAAAVKKTVVAEHIALLKGMNIDPAFVGLDSLTLYNLNQLTLSEDAGTYAIVDLGHVKTSVCIVSNRSVKFVRTLFSGGKAITDAIRDGLDLTWEQAQEVKHRHGILEMESRPLQSKDLRRLSAAIRNAIDPLIRETSQTFQAYRAQYSQVPNPPGPVERIYLCGGTSMIRNLAEYTTMLTNLPVSHLEIFPSHHDASKRLGDRQPTYGQAVALGLRGAARGAGAKQVTSLNFRKNEFAFAKDLSGIKEKAYFFGRWAAVVFLFALVHLAFTYQNLSRQYRSKEKQILATFADIVRDEPNKPKNSPAALKVLESRIQKYQQKQEILTAGLNEVTALGVLREISSRIPADIPLDSQELSIERNKIVLRANTDSFASVDKVIAALKEFPHFQKIEKGDIRESPEGKKTFLITVTVGGEEPKDTKSRRSG